MRTIIALAVALLSTAAPAYAQHSHGAGTAQPAPHPSDPYEYGLFQLHNFEYDSAAAAFRAAQQADPANVMAYWGEAMTHNHPLWDEQDRDAAQAVLARLGATAEIRAAKARTPREKAWLGAVEALYGEGTKPQRDLAYLAKMRELLASDPTDIDARAFAGLATLGSSHGGRQIPIYMEAAAILEEGYITHPRHPGILHYLIHSYDDPVHAPLGLRMARSYAVIAPDAGHAQHMVSHIYNGLGMWAESERANTIASGVTNKDRAKAGKGRHYCGHYNEWLVYARLQQGKDVRPAIEGCRSQAEAELASFKSSAKPGLPAAAVSYGDMALRYGIETGQWLQPLDFSQPSYVRPRFDFAYARMLASRGNAAESAAALAELRTEAAGTIAQIKRMSSGTDDMAPWIEAAVAQGEAIHSLSGNDVKSGLRQLRAAAAAEAAMPPVFGPPAIRKPSYELLGEILLELGRKEEAAEAFRKSLRFAPGRRLSVAGLAKATE